MKNRLLTLFAVSALFAACQSELPEYAGSVNSPKVTATFDNELLSTFTVGKIIGELDTIARTSAWKEALALEDKFKLCDYDMRLLETLSTEEIIKISMSHPMRYMYLAYSNPFSAIDYMFEHSNVLKILTTREDCSKKLVDFYSRVTPDVKDRGQFTVEEQNIDLGFLTYIIASGRFDDALVGENADIIESTIRKLVSYKKSLPDFFSSFSMYPEVLISERIRNSAISPDRLYAQIEAAEYSGSSQRSIQYITIYTRAGEEIEAMLRSPDITDFEKANYAQQTLSMYPNVEILAPATKTYNCHSYAWNMFDGIIGLNQSYTTCWINSTDSDGTFQLSKFWNDGTYRATIPLYGTVIYYDSYSSHSATSTEVGVVGRRYISKWGILPLVRHLPTDCPYDSSNRSYYTRRPISAYVTGEDFIVTGQTYTYTLHCPEPGFFNIEWAIEDLHDIPEHYSIVSNVYTAEVTFNRSGEYYIYAKIYDGDTLLTQSNGVPILVINQ